MMDESRTNPPFAGRVRALLHGIALGDAMGAPVEKLSPDAIRSKYGRVTSVNTAWHRDDGDPATTKGRVRGNGIVTDDTLMTLCLTAVYSDVRRHLDAWDMADGMVRQIAWVPRYVPELQSECSLLERLFYPEKWIFQRHQLSACDPRQGGIGNMVNCGAAMYIAPVGVVNACDPQAAYDEAIAFASGHQQSFGLEAAGVLAGAVAAAFIPGTTIDEIAKTAHSLAKDGTRTAIEVLLGKAEMLRDKGADHAEVTDSFHREIARFSPMGDDLDHTARKAGKATPNYQPSRFSAIEELPLALAFATLNKGDFRKSLEDGINSGRDTDSIGVMVGAILGALHGEPVIDQQEADQLDRVNKLDLGAEAATFTQAAMAIMNDDHDRIATLQDNRAQLMPHPAAALPRARSI